MKIKIFKKRQAGRGEPILIQYVDCVTGVPPFLEVNLTEYPDMKGFDYLEDARFDGREVIFRDSRWSKTVGSSLMEGGGIDVSLEGIGGFCTYDGKAGTLNSHGDSIDEMKENAAKLLFLIPVKDRDKYLKAINAFNHDKGYEWVRV